MRRAVATAAALFAIAQPAVAAEPDDAERTRIARERAEADARHADRVAGCNRRFVVTACIDDARAERRDALANLAAQERVLDEAARKRRAAVRVERIRKRIDSKP